MEYEQYITKNRNEIFKEMKKANSPTVGAIYEPNQTEKNLISDKLNYVRPVYYGGAGNAYELFNVLEAWNLDKDFYLGNVIKYIARAGKKDSAKTKEDLEKALVYLRRRIDSL